MDTFLNLSRTLRIFAGIMAVLYASLSHGANTGEQPAFVPQQSASPSGNTLLDTGNEPEFLPVTQAYILNSAVRDGKLILHWDIEPGYYLYQARFKLQTAKGIALHPHFSKSIKKYDSYFDKQMAIFHSGATLTLPLASQTPFKLKIESQGCADAGLCYPPHDDYLAVNPNTHSTSVISAADFAQHKRDAAPSSQPHTTSPWLASVLLFALLGGMILNLMPCVFPVLSIKVLSLASAHRQRLARHGWAYLAGVVLSFIIFAAILLAARAGGQTIGWGFQLQSPAMIIALIYLFVFMGLGLSGLLNLGGNWMGVGQRFTQGTGLGGSFFTGVLAAIVASPCTAPFMGVALGYALTQPASTALLIFAALGVGMALPLLILCYIPKLIDYLPRPGRWMELLKQALAFPLYLTALWLLWVLGRQLGLHAVITLLLGLLALAFLGWLQHHIRTGRKVKVLLTLAGIAIIAATVSASFAGADHNSAQSSSRWQVYSPTRLAQLRAEGRPVLVDITADWCLTCLANERLTLDTDAMHRAFDRYNVATLKGDWTHRDPQLTRLLTTYHRSGVPLYLWFAPNNHGKGEILPQLLRQKHLQQRFAKLNPKKPST